MECWHSYWQCPTKKLKAFSAIAKAIIITGINKARNIVNYTSTIAIPKQRNCKQPILVYLQYIVNTSVNAPLYKIPKLDFSLKGQLSSIRILKKNLITFKGGESYPFNITN